MIEARVLPLSVLYVLLVSAVACGGDETSTAVIDGGYFITYGAQQRTVLLDKSGVQVTCKPKPGLKEFEYKATVKGKDGKESVIHLEMKEYSESKSSYDLKYDAKNPLSHKLTVTIDDDYKYVFLQSFRTDSDTTFNSECKLDLTSDEGQTDTEYSASLFCTQLWSDFSSKDYFSGILNNYIDIAAKFSCKY